MCPREQLLLDRDPHGNVQVAKIETEVLLAQSVEAELDKLAAVGEQREDALGWRVFALGCLFKGCGSKRAYARDGLGLARNIFEANKIKRDSIQVRVVHTIIN